MSYEKEMNDSYVKTVKGLRESLDGTRELEDSFYQLALNNFIYYRDENGLKIAFGKGLPNRKADDWLMTVRIERHNRAIWHRFNYSLSVTYNVTKLQELLHND